MEGPIEKHKQRLIIRWISDAVEYLDEMEENDFSLQLQQIKTDIAERLNIDLNPY